MKTLLAIVATSLVILLAKLADIPAGWWLALLGVIAVWIIHALINREQRVENRIVEQVVWDDVVNFVASVEQKSEEHPVDRD